MVGHFRNPKRNLKGIILWFVYLGDLDSQNLYWFSREVEEVGRRLFLLSSDEKPTLIFLFDYIPTVSSFLQNEQPAVLQLIKKILRCNCVILEGLPLIVK